MSEIIPRWEWRTFGSRFGLAEAAFADMEPESSADSDELYFDSPGTSNVKIRAELLDIKALKEVGNDGLEQWTPVMKEPFPLSSDAVSEVFDAFGVPAPPLDRATYTLDEFLTELVDPSPEVSQVAVHKHRVRYTVGGCTSEFTDVTISGQPTRTIAVESEDRAAVLAAVKMLGFDGFVNMSYKRGLSQVLGGVRDIFAVIDVGTNSVKFHLGERALDGTWTTLVDRAEMTRLGEDLDADQAIIDAAAVRTADAIAGMANEAREAGAIAIIAVGTAGLRIARNSADVIEAIRQRSGVSVDVISGEEESRLAYIAVQATLGLSDGQIVVFDTGGGSSQFTFGHGSHVSERFSVDVGAVRFTEQFGLDGPVSSGTLTDALQAISAALTSIDERDTPDAMVGMGGAITNITAVAHSLVTYDAEVVQGSTLDQSEIDRQIGLYASMDADGRRTIVGLQPKRAEVILAGACIVKTVMAKLRQQSLTVSDRGLRHGITVERFGADISG